MLQNDIIPFLKNSKTSLEHIEQFTGIIKNNLADFLTSFESFSDTTIKFQNVIKQYFESANLYLMQIRDVLIKISQWYYPDPLSSYSGVSQQDVYDIKAGWHSFWSTFRYKKFDEVLLEVNQKIEDKVNPLSENNSVAFEGAITNIKDNTFIGSANEMVTTFPEELKGALNKDSSPVLQFKTVAVKNSYFSLPAKTYSIDFSFWAPFKGTADALISAFMYLGFLIILFKRLPEILHGSGVVRDNYSNFQEAQFNDIVANDYYNYLVDNGGVDDF